MAKRKAATLRTEHPKTFGELVDIIEKLRTAQKEDLWFRGSNNAEYKLLPSLYRHRTKTKIDELSSLERVMNFKPAMLQKARKTSRFSSDDLTVDQKHQAVASETLENTGKTQLSKFITRSRKGFADSLSSAQYSFPDWDARR
jgi:hypothetical protein